MIRRCLDAVCLVLASLVTAVMAALIALAIVLATGSVPLTALEPTLRSMVARAAPELKVTFQSPALRWNPEVRELELAVRDLDIRGRNGKELLHVAQAAVSPDLATSLKTGSFSVKRLVLDGPTVTVTRQAGGGLGLRILNQEIAQGGPGNGDPWAAAADFLGRVLAPPAADDPLAGIEILRVQDAKLLVEDESLKRRVQLGGGTLEFRRQPGPGKIDAQIGLGADGSAGQIHVQIRQEADPERYELHVGLRDVNPSLLPMAEAQPVLRDIDIVADGSLRGSLTADGHPSPVTFRVSSRPTTLSLPGQLAAPVAVGPMEVGGSIDLEAKLLRIERATGSVAGSDVTASGQLSLGADGIGGKGEATIKSVDAGELVRLWPEGAASDARQWVSTHVEAGTIGQATADLSLQPAQGDQPAALDLSGTFSASGVTVRYLDDAPPARDVSATARFSKDELTFQLTGGRSRDVRVDGGEVRLTGLAGDTTQLATDLRLASTVPAALDLLGSLPKDIVPSLPVSPDKARGQATIRLRLGLPLADAISADQVRYDVQAQLDNLVVLGLVPGLDLSEGQLSLEVAGSALTASGKARLQTVPLTLKQLRVDFSGKGPPATTAEISGHLEPISLSMLGVEPPPFLDGAADIDLTLDLAGAEPSKAHVVADLQPTVIKLPALRIDKSAGQPGRLVADIDFTKADAVTLPSLSLSLPDVEVRGSLALAGQDHHLTRLDLDRLDLQGSRLSLAVSSKQGGGWDASLGGERLDLRPWLGGGKGSGGGGASQAGGAGGQPLPALALKVDVAEVALPGGSLRNLKGSVERSASQWQQGSIAADLANGKPVQATLGSSKKGSPRLEVRTDDAGAFLGALTAGNPLAPGGTLSLAANILAEDPILRLKGDLNLRGVTVRGAPLLAKLLTLASFTGILNTLQGKGIYFDRVRTSFALAGDTLTLTDGKAHGSAVGLTAAGVVNLDAGTLAINGTVVPAYMVNKLLGDVPVLGRLLRGENGVGAFAVTYNVKGPWGDPGVTVNPLSVLVPGFIRDLFSDSDTGGDTGAGAEGLAPTKR